MEHDVDSSNSYSTAQLISIALLFLVLISIPIIVAVMGQSTRQKLRAAEECTQPIIPDASECIGGEWTVYTKSDGCVGFRCQIR